MSSSNLVEACKIEGLGEVIRDCNELENIETEDKDGLRPLSAAVIYNCTSNVRTVLSLGADINIEYPKGKNILDYAIEVGNSEMVEILIMNKIKCKDYTNYLYLKYKFSHLDLEESEINDIMVYAKYHCDYSSELITV